MDRDPKQLGADYWSEVRRRGLRFGLVAGADLFQAMRLVVRMETDFERPGVFESSESLDEYAAPSPSLVALLEYAASAEFAAVLAASEEV